MTDTYTNFTAVRDKPLTILFAMILLGGRASYVELEDWCDYSRPTLRKGMKPLLHLGLIKPVTQSIFMITDRSEQLKLFAEKFFQVDSSSFINDSTSVLSIESTTTTSCKSFSASPEVEAYLKSKDVWVQSIPEIAELADNNLLLLKAHFEGTDTALAIHRIKENKPAPEVPQTGEEARKKYISGDYSDMIEH